MRILFLGDVVGRIGREAVSEAVPQMRSRLGLDFVAVNAENATQGRGITLAHASLLLSSGVDCLTLGDHAFDQRELISDIVKEPRLLRPVNIAHAAPGSGSTIFTDSRGRRLLVVSALGRIFMNRPFEDPFREVKRLLDKHSLGSSVQATLIDFHAEATSEKMAMGHHCDGRASLVVGTHTHVPTSDCKILRGGTGYISDAGMCGDYDSVIGMKTNEPLDRFVTGMHRKRLEPAGVAATICGVLVETEDRTGLATRIEPIREGRQFSTSRIEA